MSRQFQCRNPLNLLSNTEIQNIHHKSLQVLEEVGIRFEDKNALKIMADNGCRVDHKTGLVKIPRRLVEMSISQCPADVSLIGRDGQNEVLFNRDIVQFGPCSGMQVMDIASEKLMENGGHPLYIYIKNCVYYVTCMPRKARIAAPGGLHHILGSSDFVEAVLKKANEDLQQKYRLSTSGPNLYTLLKKVAGYYRINQGDLRTASKESTLTKAWTVLCYLAVRRLKISCADVARKLRISPATVSRAASRGADLPNLKQIQKEFLGG